MLLDIAAALIGLVLVAVAAERAVPALLSAAQGFGLSPFLLAVVVLGFDIENLFVGGAATLEGAPGIALGTVIGSAMVAVALALGVTALIVPLAFQRVPKPVLALPLAATALLWALAADGRLTRLDGAVLIAAYFAALAALVALRRRGVAIEGLAAAEASAERAKPPRAARARAAGLLALALIGLVLGSELLVTGARGLIAAAELSQTAIGMSVIALAVSAEEVARELPAAWKGRPEIALGNVLGSIFAFFLFNAAAIALINPVPVDAATRAYYLPAAAATVLLVAALLAAHRIPRWAGALLLAAYLAFLLAGPLAGAGFTAR